MGKMSQVGSHCALCSVGLLLAFAMSAQAAQQDTLPKTRARGDFRLRGELDRDRRGARDRERVRLRLRLGAEHSLGPTLELGARLVTAPDPTDPNSTHQDLGASFRNFRVAFDRAYVRWTPHVARRFEVVAGKFEPPFLTPPVFGEIVWDADIQPEGVAVVSEPVAPLRLVAAGYLLLHQANGEDVNLGAGQAALRLRPFATVAVTAAVGTYLYGTPDRDAARRLARDNQGNALVIDEAGDTLAFASRFRIWNGYASLTYDGLPLPVTAVVEYVTNASEAPGLDGDGWAVGASVGRLGKPGRWRLDYQYQSIGREAIFSAVAQDDFLDATNFDGHLLGLAIQYLPNANAYLWSLWSARDAPDEERFQKRFRLDLNFSWSLR